MGLAVSVHAVCLGHLSLALQMCEYVACACICVFVCVGVAGHVHMSVYMPVCACIPLSLGISVSVPGGRVLSVPQPRAPVCISLCLPLCVQLPHTLCACISAHVSVFSACVRASATACAHLCHGQAGVCASLVWAPLSVPVCALLLQGPSFFETDTLPPSAQINSKSPPAGTEPGAARAPGPFSFLFPLHWSEGASWAGKKGTQLD